MNAFGYCSVAVAIPLFLIAIVLLVRNLDKRVNLSFIRRFFVKKNEKGILFKEGDFVKILSPGTYWFFDVFRKNTVSIYDLKDPLLVDKIGEFLINNYPELVETNFTVADLSDYQVGLVYQDNKLKKVLSPSTLQLYWKGFVDTKIEVIDIKENYEISKDILNLVVHLPGTKDQVVFTDILDHETGLLYVDRVFVKILPPGIHAFWKFNRMITVKALDLRLQTSDISGQEIMTKDKVTLRVNISSDYLVKDPIKVVKDIHDFKDFIYKEVQFAIREVMGTNTLDELLQKKEEINKIAFDSVVNKLSEVGLELVNIGIKDIILPGDMRDILNQVVLAEKVAQANLIKRREETAATRSLLNTAKLMENNPVLLRLKELETLEKVTEKVENLSVYGGFESLLNDLVKIKDK